MAAVMTVPRAVGLPAGRSRRPAGTYRPTPVRSPRSNRAATVYRRRRLAAVALLAGCAVVAGHAGAALGGSTLATPERRPQVVTVVVEPGDTLWSIAGRIAPDADPRVVVDALVEARGTTAVVPGEAITWLES